MGPIGLIGPIAEDWWFKVVAAAETETDVWTEELWKH